MPDDSGAGEDHPPSDETIVHCRIDPTPEGADYSLLEAIAEQEGCDVTALPPMYDRLDHLLSKIYGNPPSPEAQVQLEFSYHGYRITVDQVGNATLVNLKATTDDEE